MDKLFVVIPAYNEEKNISRAIEEWYPVVERYGNDSKLLIINDGSKDRTLEIINECAQSRNDLIVLDKPNSGHGPSVVAGYRYALAHGADYVFQTDSDGQTSTEEFGDFWNARSDYDMVIGRRYRRGDGFGRLVVSRTLRLMLRVIYGKWIWDANVPYRLMAAAPLKECTDAEPDNYYLSNIFVALWFETHEKRILYLPIKFEPREAGDSFFNFKSIMRLGWQAAKDCLDFKRKLHTERNEKC